MALTALTAYSTGVGWQAQAVSYPLFRAVPAEDFLAYHAQYNEAIPLVVIVPGFLSFLACAAFPWTRPADVPRGLAGVVAGSGLVSLVSTVAWAIHPAARPARPDRPGRGDDREPHRREPRAVPGPHGGRGGPGGGDDPERPALPHHQLDPIIDIMSF